MFLMQNWSELVTLMACGQRCLVVKVGKTNSLTLGLLVSHLNEALLKILHLFLGRQDAVVVGVWIALSTVIQERLA